MGLYPPGVSRKRHWWPHPPWVETVLVGRCTGLVGVEGIARVSRSFDSKLNISAWQMGRSRPRTLCGNLFISIFAASILYISIRVQGASGKYHRPHDVVIMGREAIILHLLNHHPRADMSPTSDHCESPASSSQLLTRTLQISNHERNTSQLLFITESLPPSTTSGTRLS